MEPENKTPFVLENIFCSRCGNQESAAALFCSKCGSQLAGSQPTLSRFREKIKTWMQYINGNIDKVAIASVVVAAFGFFIYGGIYAGLIAVGLGIYSKRAIDRGLGSRRKLAVAGIWLGAAVALLAVYNAGVANGYETGIQAGMEAGRSVGHQETWDGIIDGILSLFF